MLHVPILLGNAFESIYLSTVVVVIFDDHTHSKYGSLVGLLRAIFLYKFNMHILN